MYREQIFHDKEEFMTMYRRKFVAEVGREFEDATSKERYDVLVKLLLDHIKEIEYQTEEGPTKKEKRVIYFSLEFLIGKLLRNYLINLGIEDMVAAGLEAMGENLDDICAEERDPGLGNGGLGRLAACFMDSIASLGMHGYGNGIRYRFGLFKQTIQNGCQVEVADNWMEQGYPWETRKQEEAVVVNFGGHVDRHEEDGRVWFTWEDTEKVLAVPYDVPVVGYGGKTANIIRLWAAEPVEEKFDMDAFNHGDYAKAMKYQADIEAISTLLYPDDTDGSGKVLRLKQEYMFVAAGIRNVVDYYKKRYGNDAWMEFGEHTAIHTNDTHPALCAPELMRVLIDEEGLDWDTAWHAVTTSISYTNHTVLPEAMETWPISLIESLVPRVYNFIEEINRRYRESFPRDMENAGQLLAKTAILWDGNVRMANLSIISGHSVNGVAKLHTEILKHDTLKEFYTLTPEKFNNKTNGISHRRFLIESNPKLAELITDAIGKEWITNPEKLEDLIKLEKDKVFLEDFEAVKHANKERLADYIKQTSGIIVDPDSVFDIQVKRFHAYKRQLLNVFKVIYYYNKIKENPKFEMVPATYIFSGKAAQGYAFAKDVIRFVNSVAQVVNNDPAVKGRIRVAFIKNFAVSNAQLIYPAAEISEQISTAGLEASGTGNMKFMMNGAITLGTLDGANVEIAELVGDENIKIFGHKADEIEQMRAFGDYEPVKVIKSDPATVKIIDQLRDETFAGLSGGFDKIFSELIHKNDEFFVMADFKSYIKAYEELTADYENRMKWNKIALHNVAKSGYFSSDRTIKEYAEDIWKF